MTVSGAEEILRLWSGWQSWVLRGSFGFAQDGSLGCCCDDITAAIKAKKTLSSRPQWRDLNQLAGDSLASLRATLQATH